MSLTETKIKHIRADMLKKQINACIIPSNDPHMSEYVPEHWNARAYFSGFTGSAGTLVITNKEAYLWTDSRYFIQAEKELEESEIKLFKSGEENTPTYLEWLINNLQAKNTVSLHEHFFSTEEFKSIKKELHTKKIKIDSTTDLISSNWKNRPPLPLEKIFLHNIAYTGKTFSEKFERLLSNLKERNCDTLIISSLDEIAWLLNIRGQDIKYSPLAVAYLVIENKNISLFISKGKLTTETRKYLSENNIITKEYSAFYLYLSTICNKNILLDQRNTNYCIYKNLEKSNNILQETSPICHLKSIKNKTEINGFKKAMIKDGIALTKFFIWLENCLKKKKEINELLLAEKLKEFRSQQALFHSNSFSPIVAYKENGAIVHYSPTEQSNKTIETKGLLLIDSGGQYLDGTTDITRTISLGNISDEEKRNFTFVLQGHIALAQKTFPTGTYGYQIDPIARTALQKEGLNYGHGTGHGVGHFLCVHEGPQSIRADNNKTSLKSGMIISNEPGVYITGKYGIRIENLILVNEISTSTGLLSFETLTLFPIDNKAIDFTLLKKQEINWLRNYHHSILSKLSPFLSRKETEWLKEKCQI